MKTESKLSISILLAVVAAALWLPDAAHAQGVRAAAVKSASLTTTNAWTAYSRPTTLYTVSAVNASAGTLYLHVFDATSTPAAGTVPDLCVAIPTASTGGFDFNVAGCRFANGIVVATSTTPVTFTNGTASFQITVTHTP